MNGIMDARRPGPTPSIRFFRSRLFLHELLHRAIHGIGNVNVALGAHGNEVRLAEFSPGARSAWLSNRSENFSLQVHLQKLPRETVDHIDVLFADVQRTRQSGVLHFADVLTVLIENLDSLILAI